MSINKLGSMKAARNDDGIPQGGWQVLPSACWKFVHFKETTKIVPKGVYSFRLSDFIIPVVYHRYS